METWRRQWTLSWWAGFCFRQHHQWDLNTEEDKNALLEIVCRGLFVCVCEWVRFAILVFFRTALWLCITFLLQVSATLMAAVCAPTPTCSLMMPSIGRCSTAVPHLRALAPPLTTPPHPHAVSPCCFFSTPCTSGSKPKLKFVFAAGFVLPVQFGIVRMCCECVTCSLLLFCCCCFFAFLFLGAHHISSAILRITLTACCL